jgi:hypothetical protein
LEDEINSLKQATVHQGKGIQSLEGRVSSRGQEVTIGKSSSAGRDRKAADGHATNASTREKEDLDRKYID